MDSSSLFLPLLSHMLDRHDEPIGTLVWEGLKPVIKESRRSSLGNRCRQLRS